jgi:lipoprotein-releasing system permease protein
MIKGVDPARSSEFRGFSAAFGPCAPSEALRPAQPDAAPTIAVGRQLARRLGVVPGDRLRVVAPTALDGTAAPLSEPPRAASFVVTCELDTGLSEFDERLAFVHLTAAQALLFGEGRVTGIELELHEAEAAVAVARDAEQALHRLPVGDPSLPPRFRAGSWVDQVGGVLDLVRQIRTVVSLVLMLLLVVAGGALISALLLLVRRHRHLLAVLGMLGTAPRVVFVVFEAVGVLAGLIGSLLGALLGLVLVAAVWRVRLPLAGSVYPIDHLPVRLGVLDFVWPIGLALLVCALASGPIAWSAVRPRPLDA